MRFQYQISPVAMRQRCHVPPSTWNQGVVDRVGEWMRPQMNVASCRGDVDLVRCAGKARLVVRRDTDRWQMNCPFEAEGRRRS